MPEPGLIPGKARTTSFHPLRSLAPVARFCTSLRYGGRAAKRLELSKPIDVGVLDTTVAAVYATGSKNDEILAANLILRDLEAHPHMWLQVPHILHNSNMMSTKFFALEVLESVIKNRWDDFPVEERNELPSYIINVIKQPWNSEAPFGSETVYVNKLYVILVQIVKHEWPLKLTDFIPDIIEVAKEKSWPF